MIPIPIYPDLNFLLRRRMQAESVLRSPPAPLISIAVEPLVIPAKAALIIVIINASKIPEEDARNMVTTFERPGFAPGGIPGKGGMSDSRNERESAKAAIIPRKATFFVVDLFLFINITVSKLSYLFYLYPLL